ncbi:hypothetical protein [Thermoanaerobacter sp. A7A]|uniref:hypothetical protein n=1 Tax=Thermoanaerobacter sp. A7A TaxID=1350366 RepID=UPI00042537B4|nr:hypothetical protein [Thermoanaerobacter sp. A7A]
MSKFVYICHPYSANPSANKVKFYKIFRFIKNNFKEVVPFLLFMHLANFMMTERRRIEGKF